MTATLIKKENIEFIHRGGPPGKSFVGRTVSDDMSSTMAAGIASFDACSIPWTVLYDEIVYVISGVFRLVMENETIEGVAGDTIFIEKGTSFNYEGDEASIFYAVYPGNWKSLTKAQ